MNLSMAIKSALATLIARENMRRAEAGERPLTQTEIAKRSHVNQSVISTLVNGKSRRIDFDTIDKLSQFFGVHPGELFTYTPDTTPQK